MKKFFLFIVGLLFTHCLFAQVAPITGPGSICIGDLYPDILSDVTPGGTWSSSNTTVAIIGSTTGIITGLSAGVTNVVYRVGPSTATLAVVVNPAPGAIMGVDSFCNGASTSYLDTSGTGTWTSEFPAIATVNPETGLVTGVSPGVTTLTFTLTSTGCQTIKTVSVDPVPLTITGVKTISNITGGDTTTLHDTLTGIWSSSSTFFATVVPTTGLVTGLNTGLVDITYSFPTGCFAYTTISINQLPDTAIIGGLLAWYPFCDDYKDHSGNGHDLVNSGTLGGVTIASVTATSTTDRFGDATGAFDFGNSEMHWTSYFNPVTLTNNMTFSCWIYATSAQNSVIWYNGNLGTLPAHSNGFGIVMNSGAPYDSVLGTASPYNPVPGLDVSVLFGGFGQFASTPIMLNTWYNLELVKNGNAYKFYVNQYGEYNGVPSIFTVIPSYLPLSGISGSLFTVGNDSALNRGFQGMIDDIAVYNRALTNVENEELFNFNPDIDSFSFGPNRLSFKTQDTTICTDSITLYPSPQTLGSMYIWGTTAAITGIVTTYDTTVVDTSLTVDPPPSTFFGTSYWLTMIKPFGCLATDTIVVFKAPIPVSLGANQNVCLGDTITLIAHGDSSNAVKFSWNTGSVGDSIKVTHTGTYWVTVDSEFYFNRYVGTDTIRDSALCVGRDTVTINVHAVPQVNLGPDVGSCLGQPYTIRNLDSAYDYNYVYTWSVGTSADTLLVTTSGTFWVNVNDSGCSRADTIRVTIVWDTVLLHDPRDTAICLGTSITPNTSITPLVGINYQWTPTDGMSVSTIPQPLIVPDTSSWYVLKATYPGCPVILDSFFIDVQPVPFVYAGGNRPVCKYDTLHITANVSPQWYPYYTYTWTPTGSIDNPNASTVVFTAGDSTNLIVTVSTPYGCTSKDSAFIIVHPGSFDSALANIYLCPGDSVQLMPMLNASGIANGTVASYKWSPGLYLNDSNTNQPWVHPITSIQYRQIGISQFGCEDTNNVSVTVYPAAVIFLGDSLSVQPGQKVQLVNTSNCYFFDWTPATGLNDTSISEPEATPYESTEYKVRATTQDGCTVFDSIAVHVTPRTLVAVPNAFTPGNGVNNILYVLSKGAVAINYFRIFDRWGVKIFESNNINDGWDGTSNGKPQPMGVYVYEVEAVNSVGDVYDQSGNVTLIR